jgi:hypothetical protein
MNVSKTFLKDFAYLANRYGWTPTDIEDIKAQTRLDPGPMMRYWTILANAHRAGYQQTRANRHIRLQAWCAENGHPAPYMLDDYTHGAIDFSP